MAFSASLTAPSVSGPVRSGGDAGREEHPRVPDAARRRLPTLGRGDPAPGGPAPADLVQRLPLPGDRAQRRQPPDLPPGLHADHQGDRQVRQAQPPGPPPRHLHLQAHLRRPTRAQGLRRDQHLLSGNCGAEIGARVY